MGSSSSLPAPWLHWLTVAAGGTKRGSPGNLRAFEDMVDMSAKESAPALALMLGAGAGGAKRVGVAFAENGANLIRTVEFDDDEQFSQLET